MENKLPRKQSFWSDQPHSVRAIGSSLLLALVLSGTAFGQQIPVTGTVSSAGGAPLQGVTVGVQGTETRALTNAAGRYFVNAPTNGVLTFVSFGKRPVQETIAGRVKIDVTMSPISYLEEIVVTAYTEQRRGDITGAVSSLNVESAERIT